MAAKLWDYKVVKYAGKAIGRYLYQGLQDKQR